MASVLALGGLAVVPTAAQAVVPAFGQVLGSPFAIAGQPTSVAFSPGGGLLAVGTSASSVAMFSVAANGTLSQVPGSPFAAGGPADQVAFSPSGGLVAVDGDDGTEISVLSVAASGTLTPVPGSPFTDSNGAGSVAFSPDGDLLAVGSIQVGAFTNNVSIYSVAANGALTELPGSPYSLVDTPTSVAFSPDGHLLAVSGALHGSKITMFSVAGGGTLTQVPHSPFSTGREPLSVAFSPTGALLATANFDGDSVSLFKVGPNGGLSKVKGTPYLIGGGAASVAFSGGILAVSDTSNALAVLSVGAHGTLTPLPGSPYATNPGTEPFGIALNPEASLLASADEGDDTISMFTAATGADVALRR